MFGLLALAGATFPIACSDARPMEVNPGLACGSSLAVCDIHSAACRQDVLDVVACLRGYDTQVRQPIATFIELNDLVGGSESSEDIPEEKDARDTRLGYSLFGLVATDEVSAEDALAAQADSIAALYSPEQQRVFILENPGGEALSEAELGMPVEVYQMTVLAHEYVHFLQDQETDLAAFSEQLPELFDPAMAGISAIEGEAVLFEAFFGLQLAGRRVSREPVVQQFEAYVDFAEEAIREAASPALEARYLFPYSYGAHSAAVVHFDGGSGAVAGLRRSSSTLEYIQRRWAEPLRRATPEPAEPTAPDGLSSIHSDQLGPWLLAAFASRSLGISSDQALAFASHWSVDRVRVFRADDEEVVAHWLLEFEGPTTGQASSTGETEVSLREWAGALQGAAPGATPTWLVASKGNSLEIIASTRPDSAVARTLADSPITWGDAGADGVADAGDAGTLLDAGTAAVPVELPPDAGFAATRRTSATAALVRAEPRTVASERLLGPRMLTRREKARARLARLLTR